MTLLAVLACAAPLVAADPEFEAMEQEAAAQEKAQEGFDVHQAKAADLAELSGKMQGQYARYLEDLDRQDAKVRELVLKQWSSVQESTPKKWVDYGDGGDTVSAVDFEKGRVEVEVLVPVSEIKAGAPVRALAEKKLEAQVKRLLAEPALSGQLEGAQAPAYVKTTLAPKMVVEDKRVVAKDGIARVRVKVSVPLVPGHLKLRAQRYEARVKEAAGRYGLDPALLLAVMQTESEFNPRARSQAPAFGLMQLMPKTGAYEAYKHLYKQEKLVTPEYLYDPDNNILLGATYLHMLNTRHFGKVKNQENRRTLMIAAYNCGPGCVRKHVLSKGDPDALTNEELLALVGRTVPQETRHYVPRVQSRIAAWKL